jgi:GH18 family chitinase
LNPGIKCSKLSIGQTVKVSGASATLKANTAVASTYEIIAYYPNWVLYQQTPDGQVPHIINDVDKITEINYAFSFISYDQTNQRWYLDFPDPWGEFALCNPDQIPYVECSDNDLPLPNSCADSTGTQRIVVAPFLGYLEPSGTCREASDSTCFNKGGAEGSDGTKVRCSTYIPNIQAVDSSYNYGVGQMNYILKKVKEDNGAVKNSISLGGWYDSNYFTSATNSTNMDKFMESVKAYMSILSFDNIDIDWEYPGFEHGNQPNPGDNTPPFGTPDDVYDCDKDVCKVDRSNDADQLKTLISRIRSEVTNSAGETPKITIAAPASAKMITKLDISGLCDLLDGVNIMTYDINGAFSAVTNHQSAIYPPEYEDKTCVDSAVTAFLDGGCPAEKIAIGVPFYGRVFAGVNDGSIPIGCGRTQAAVSEEGCWQIGASNGISVIKLEELNQPMPDTSTNLDCDTHVVQPGEIFCVCSKNVQCTDKHIVVSGDTCVNVATQYGLTLAQLQAFNPDTDCSALQIDYQLCVAGNIPPKFKSTRATDLPGLYQEFTQHNPTPEDAVKSYYHLVNDILPNGYTTHWDDTCKASYAYNEDQAVFISYDDTHAVQAKIEYVKRRGLRGVIIWMYSQDDQSGTLLNTIFDGLYPANSS